MKISTQHNISAHVKQSERRGRALDEGPAWDRNPSQLTRTLFYMNGVNFDIRGGKEHVILSISQFRVELREGSKVLYNEGVTKTYQRGLNQRRPKPVKKIHYENIII